MAGKRLLDLAALFKVTRNIAFQHVTLQRHRLDSYNKTSSLAKAAKSQIDRSTSSAEPDRVKSQRLNKAGKGHDTKQAPNERHGRDNAVPGHESVQSSENSLERNQGLDQDHFYEKSQNNSTIDPPPSRDIGIKQAEANTVPLPDGSIPLAETEGPGKNRDQKAALSVEQQPARGSSSEVNEQLRKTSERAISERGSVPGHSESSIRLTAEEARVLQRQAERQIPSQAAKGPAPETTNVRLSHSSTVDPPELSVGQEQDVFYTPSTEAGQVLSALPRVKLPKNIIDEQQSNENVPDKQMNQDVFYSAKKEPSEHPSLSESDQPSDEIYSELFHSPRVAKMLTSKINYLNGSKVADSNVKKDKTLQVDASTTNSGQRLPNKKPKMHETQDVQKGNKDEGSIEELAADLAKDAKSASSKDSTVSIWSRIRTMILLIR